MPSTYNQAVIALAVCVRGEGVLRKNKMTKLFPSVALVTVPEDIVLLMLLVMFFLVPFIHIVLPAAHCTILFIEKHLLKCDINNLN